MLLVFRKELLGLHVPGLCGQHRKLQCLLREASMRSPLTDPAAHPSEL